MIIHFLKIKLHIASWTDVLVWEGYSLTSFPFSIFVTVLTAKVASGVADK